MQQWLHNHIVAVTAACLMLVLLLITPDDENERVYARSDASAAASTPAPAIPSFSDRTLAARLTHVHHQGDDALTGLNETLGPGACAFDYDNDDWVDLFAVGGSGDTRYYGRAHWWQTAAGHRLYRNRGDGTFDDVTTAAGLQFVSWGMGCAIADLDNDGDQDLLVTNIGRNALYRNNGDGTFVDITAAAGINGDAWSTGAAFGDYDQDGWLDVYIVNYLKYAKGAHTFESFGGFDLGALPGFNSQLYDGVSNQLFRNMSGMRFEEVTDVAGVADASGRGMHAAWFDVNRDRYPDLLVLNDGGFPHRLFVNERNGRFVEQGALYGLSAVLAGANAAFGDIDADSDGDIILTSTAGNLPKLLMRDDLGRNGRAPFHDDGRVRGLADERSAGLEHWSAALADFNNDGFLDVFMPNGLRTPDPMTTRITQGQSKSMWLGRAHGEFVPVDIRIQAALNDRVPSRGVAIADFDNNGALDIYVSNNNELGQLLHNSPNGGHFLGVLLVATEGNRDAIGARVSLRTVSGEQLRHVLGGGGFLSSSDHRLHFGLGTNNSPGTLTIEWPDGAKQIIDDVPADQYVRITQGRNGWETLSHRPHATNATHAPTDDTAARAVAIAQAVRASNAGDLALLTSATEDSAPEIRAFAVEALRLREDELASRWLMRLFADPDSTVKVTLANTYAHWFHEEEAVVHRKHLAVPHLVRLLDDPDVEVRVAATHALGESENFRGVYPLVSRLGDSSTDVQVAAACALGKIRERQAIPALRNVAANDGADPRVRAHALIALKRLNDDRLEALWKSIEAAALDSNDPAARTSLFKTAQVIVTDRVDGIVYNPHDIAQRAQHWFSRSRRGTAGFTLDSAARLSYLAIVDAARRTDAATDAALLLKDSDPVVRQRAAIVVANLGGSNTPRRTSN